MSADKTRSLHVAMLPNTNINPGLSVILKCLWEVLNLVEKSTIPKSYNFLRYGRNMFRY